MYLETKRILIRDFKPQDAADLHEILGDDETMAYCEPAYSLEKTESFLAEFCIAKKGAVAAVHKESDKVIGYILFHSTEESVYEIGWFFNKQYWRQGYAYEACAKIITHAFHDQNAHKIFAESTDAEKSIPLMRKLGMKPEGIQRSHTKDNAGNWTDLHLYGLLKGESCEKNITK
ncbi:MAG: GNAT family N-acetyltransferase [Lachnospiraceae bacterium]|nr:GNAT family N-acetyltransferase [Lachnospiraceae bacterium]